MKNYIKQALIVCKEKTDIDTLRAHVLSLSAHTEVTEIETAKDTLAYIQRLTLAKVKIPDMIFLDTSCSFEDSKRILSMLDKYYPATSRKSVFLINRQFTLDKIMRIVRFDCVKDILTTPVLKYELPSQIGRVKTLA
jgi:hypothetical protein